MPRKRPPVPRKVGNHSYQQMKEALDAIKAGTSIREAANKFGIPNTTLTRYAKLHIKEGVQKFTPNYAVRKIFTEDQEMDLHKYFINCSYMFYGLTVKNYRTLAYEMAILNNVKVPANWEKHKMAGKDWLNGFRERFPNITVQRPESSTLARTAALKTVERFYDNLQNVTSRSPVFADGTRIYNLDETAINTVSENSRVMTERQKNVIESTSDEYNLNETAANNVVSENRQLITEEQTNTCKDIEATCNKTDEKGTLVTTCNIISAGGQALPPVLVFPRENLSQRITAGMPPGSLILANPSGLNSSLFPEVMKHFVKHTGSTKDHPSLLIMDTDDSHLSIEALTLAKDAGVIILTLHPHCNKVQPLVSIHDLFKSHYASAMESWMMAHPGSPVTIYEVGGLVGQAFENAMTPDDIKSACKITGIHPIDTNVSLEKEFLPSGVTDRPLPEDPATPRINKTRPNSEPPDTRQHIEVTEALAESVNPLDVPFVLPTQIEDYQAGFSLPQEGKQ